MKNNETNDGKTTGLSNRSTMLALIRCNIAIAMYLLLTNLFSAYLPDSIPAIVLGGVWELFIFFIFFTFIASLVILFIKIFKKSWLLIYPYLITVVLNSALLFGLPYLLG